MITEKECCGTCECFVKNHHETICIAFLEIRKPDDGVDCEHWCRTASAEEGWPECTKVTNE